MSRRWRPEMTQATAHCLSSRNDERVMESLGQILAWPSALFDSKVLIYLHVGHRLAGSGAIWAHSTFSGHVKPERIEPLEAELRINHKFFKPENRWY
eukprot:s126_g13.t1